MASRQSKRAGTTETPELPLTEGDVIRIGEEQINVTTSFTERCLHENFATISLKSFYGTENTVEALRWLERMEIILKISESSGNDKVKQAVCSFRYYAITWWEIQEFKMGKEIADTLTWAMFRGIFLEKYCPVEAYWNHTMVEANIEAYTLQFQEFTHLLPQMFPTEQERIEKYIRGLVPEIRDTMVSTEPSTLKDTIELARELTNEMVIEGMLTKKVLYSLDELTDDDDVLLETSPHQTVESYGMANPDQGTYRGIAPKCNKCRLHHRGRCPSCKVCGKTGHFTRSCRKKPQKLRKCFSCGSSKHFQRDCSRNQEHVTIQGNEGVSTD